MISITATGESFIGATLVDENNPVIAIDDPQATIVASTSVSGSGLGSLALGSIAGLAGAILAAGGWALVKLIGSYVDAGGVAHAAPFTYVATTYDVRYGNGSVARIATVSTRVFAPDDAARVDGWSGGSGELDSVASESM